MLMSDLILAVLPRVGRIPAISGITIFGAATSVQSLIYKNLLDRKSDLLATGDLDLSIPAFGYYATLPSDFLSPAERLRTEELVVQPDILDDLCTSLTGWTDVSDNSGAVVVFGGFNLKTGATIGSDAGVNRILVTPPEIFTLQIKSFLDAVGSYANTDGMCIYYTSDAWSLVILLASDGLYIFDSTGAILVAAGVVHLGIEQTWLFQVDRSAGDANAIVTVQLEGAVIGTFDCSNGNYGDDGEFNINQFSGTTANQESHISEIKIGTGTGTFSGGRHHILEPNYLNDDNHDDSWWASYGMYGDYDTPYHKPKTFKIVGSTVYIRPKPTVDILLKGKYNQLPTTLTLATQTIPWQGKFDEIFIEGSVRILVKGLAVPESDADFMLFFKREFDSLINSRSRLIPQNKRLHRSNYL